MKKLLPVLMLLSTSALAQINWAQFNLPILPNSNPLVLHQIEYDQNGSAIIPAGEQGVVIFDGTSMQLFNGDNVPELQGRNIVGVQIDQNNKKWFLDGMTMNLITYDGTNWTYVPESFTSVSALGVSLKIDASGNLWAVVWSSTYNIAKFDGTGWTFYNSLMPGGYMYNMWSLPLDIDNLGRLVWCDGQAIHWFDGNISDTVTVWGGGLQNNFELVTDMELDANNDVWVIVSGDPDRIGHYNGSSWEIEDCPFISFIHARLKIDEQGNFWVPADNTLWEKTNGTWDGTNTGANLAGMDISIDPQNNWWFYRTDTIYNNENNYITIFDSNGVNTISGSVYYDLNANGIQDVGEPAYPNQIVKLDPLNYYQITDDSGHYQFGLIDSSGNYDVTFVPKDQWYTSSSPTTYTVTQDYNLESTTGIDFGTAPLSFFDDAVVGASQSTTKRGHDTYFDLSIYNNGTTYLSGELTLTFDPLMEYVNASVTPDQINGNIITWSYADLLPGYSKSITVTCHIPMSVDVGTILTSTASVTPLNTDVDQSNNSITLEPEVLSSSDPNIKTVYPIGTGSEGIIEPGTTLLYTVHFQNTGNATADNVTVIDALDPDLDITSLQVIGNSHPYQISVIENNTLQFTFNNIQLPDSGTDEAGSHGFIQYRIRPYDSAPIGSQIWNTASIIFDSNLPVVTNYILNTLGFATGISQVQLGSASFSIYPNPASSLMNYRCNENSSADFRISIYNLQGQKVLEQEKAGCEGTIDIESLAAGIYEIVFNDGKNISKALLAVQF